MRYGQSFPLAMFGLCLDVVRRRGAVSISHEGTTILVEVGPRWEVEKMFQEELMLTLGQIDAAYYRARWLFKRHRYPRKARKKGTRPRKSVGREPMFMIKLSPATWFQIASESFAEGEEHTLKNLEDSLRGLLNAIERRKAAAATSQSPQ